MGLIALGVREAAIFPGLPPPIALWLLSSCPWWTTHWCWARLAKQVPCRARCCSFSAKPLFRGSCVPAGPHPYSRHVKVKHLAMIPQKHTLPDSVKGIEIRSCVQGALQRPTRVTTLSSWVTLFWGNQPSACSVLTGRKTEHIFSLSLPAVSLWLNYF